MRKIITLMLFFVFFSCQEESSYEYEFGVKSYMKEMFNISQLEGRYYYLFLDNCDSCLGDDLNLKLFIDNPTFKETTLVFVGTPIDKAQEEKVKLIERKYKILKDPKKLIFSYETGFFKPLLLDYRNNKFKFSKEIEDFDIPFLEEYLK